MWASWVFAQIIFYFLHLALSAPQYHLSTAEGWDLGFHPAGYYVTGDDVTGTVPYRDGQTRCPPNKSGTEAVAARQTQEHLGLLCSPLCGAKVE